MRLTMILSAALLLALISLTGCSNGWRGDLHEHEISGTKAVSPGADSTELSVRAVNGSIRIEASEGADLRVEATVRAQTAERARGAVLRMEESDKGIVVYVEFPGKRRNNEGAELRLWAPAFGRVLAKTSNGSIRVVGVGERVRLSTSNGSLAVEHVPASVVATTSNGRVEINGATERAELKSSNGTISVGTVLGDAVLKTSNGKITAGPVSGSVDATTSNGSVRLTLAPAFAGELIATTNPHSGLHFADGDKFDRDADVSIEKGKLRILVGSPEHDSKTSRVSTSNGSIKVVVATGEP